MLLLDEPLGALDLKLRKGLQVELKRIQREVGITFVYVTHDQEEALTMCDRIAVMNRGRIEQIADPEEVYERPATTFVAGFIGVSNLMPATVRRPGGTRCSLDHGPDRDAPTRTGSPPASAATRWSGPEKLQIATPRSGDGRRPPASRGSSRARSTWAPRPRSPSTSART